MEVIEVTEREVEIIEIIERGPAGPQGSQPDINYEVVSSARTLEAADLIAADTSGGAFTLTLPLNPSNGDAVDIFDFSETFDTNPLTIARNGSKIESLTEDLVCNVEGAYFTLIYTGATRGWQVLPRYGTSGGAGESTLTTQGDMLYRGVGINTRLPIGSAGQILKVNSGATAPEWGAAPATGVTSVSGTTPIVSSGGATPTISITAATTSAAGSMSSADKTKLDAITGTNTGDQTITLTGNVTGSGTGSFAATIANDAVDNTKLSNMAQSTLKGRATASTGDPEDLSASQVRTILNVADGAEVNVQANWTEASSGSDAFIQNKPTLGTASTKDAPATGNASSTQVVLGNDTRLSDARTPSSTLAHAASHAAAGSDPLAPSDIGAQSVFSVESLVITTTAQVTLTAARAKIYDIVQYAGAQVDVKLPSTNAIEGDIIVMRWGTGGDSIRIIQSSSPSPITTVSSGEQKRFIRGSTDFWSLVPVDTHTHPATAISDSTTAGRALLTGADAAAQRTSLGLGTAATSATGDFAAASHSHGNINSSGQVGSDSGRVLVTTTAGAVTTLALGTANQVLRTKSDLSGVEFADPAAAGVTGAAASASDVLGVSGANITGVDATADRIVYWNNTSNKLAYGTPSDAGAAAASHTHAASDITSGLAASATTDTTNASNISSGTLGTARLGTGTANSGTFLRGDQTWAAVSGVTTGSVDNAIIRADGTGGSTSQSSDINILDATTSTQNNVAITNEHSGQTNSALVLSPKGTGAFIVGARPTGAATTGNARGANATDLQQVRSAATQVASGTRSGIMCGTLNTNAGLDAFLGGGDSCSINSNGSYAFLGGGDGNSVSGYAASVLGGFSNVASGQFATAFGYDNTASGNSSTALGMRAVADRETLVAVAGGRFASDGDAQRIAAILRGKTTTNAAVELLMGLSNNVRLTIASGKVMAMLINITGVKSDGSAVAHYVRQYAIKNVGGTTSEVYAAATIGTDNAASTSITLSANDTNDALKIEVTGIASETWRWVASVDAVEVAYGA